MARILEGKQNSIRKEQDVPARETLRGARTGPREEAAPLKPQISRRILKEFVSVWFGLKRIDTEEKLMIAGRERSGGDG